jgi:hypothetical protein
MSAFAGAAAVTRVRKSHTKHPRVVLCVCQRLGQPKESHGEGCFVRRASKGNFPGTAGVVQQSFSEIKELLFKVEQAIWSRLYIFPGKAKLGAGCGIKNCFDTRVNF